MTNKITISASIVLYKENFKVLENTINCFLKIKLSKKIFLIDNTPQKLFKNKFTHDDVIYISTEKNLGFGAGHNLVLNKIKEKSSYHLILNPDVTFSPDIIPNLIEQLKKDKSLMMVAPRVLFPNENHQYSCRRYPNPKELFGRKFSLFNTIVSKGEYRDKDLTQPFYPEYITGCFHLYKTEDLVAINGFDERYFLYMEDVDICRKIDQTGKKKMYYPQETIYHVLKKGSSKSFTLFLRHLSSAIKYFRKWGFS